MRGGVEAGSLALLDWDPLPEETTVFMIRHADKWCSPIVSRFIEMARHEMADA